MNCSKSMSIYLFWEFEYLTLSMVNLYGTKVNNQNAVKKMKFILKITVDGFKIMFLIIFSNF